MPLARFSGLSPALILLVTVGCSGGASSADPAITVAFVNGRVWTGDSARPEAEAVAIAGERIAAVGSSAEIRALAGNAEVVDLGGQFVTPGFIDTHVHFLEAGSRLASVQLRDAATREEFVARIRAFAATVPAGTWILGGDWDHTLWGGELPHRAWIDAVTPDHPVWVTRLDGHMSLANTAALRAAGVGDRVSDVPGGAIIRDPDGRITGLLKDNAESLVADRIPPASAEMRDRALQAAMTHVAERGVTTVHHMGHNSAAWEELEVFARAWRAGTLRTRIYAGVPLSSWARLDSTVRARVYGPEGLGDAWLRVGLLKALVDGSLGSHTAAFHQPFTDAPGDSGLFINTPEDLHTWISGADRAGLHVTVHAIGDRANGMLLDLFGRVASENGYRDRRFRVEHAQHLASVDVPRFAQLGVIASMQPYHAIDDGRWAERVIGPERIKTTYAFRDLISAGAHVAFGSDWFVAPPTPLEGIHAAVTRQTLDGANPDGWVPAQRITVEEALRAYTREGAYASFEEGAKGMLAPGMLADLVVLERDPRVIPPVEIRSVRVMRTVVGGRTVYQRP